MKMKIMKILFPLLLIAGLGFIVISQNSINPNAKCAAVDQQDSIYKGKPIDFMSQVKMANPKDFLYKVEQRFVNHIYMDQLKEAKTVEDIYPTKETENVTQYSETELSYYTAFGKQIIKAQGKNLSDNQLNAIASLDISSTFFLKSYVKYKNEKFTKELFYAFSVVPKSSASYQGGYEQLIDELKANTIQATTQFKANEIPLARVKFRVSETGKVTNSEIHAYSGNLEVDNILINAVKQLKTDWKPATNKQGEKVAQDLFFFFGMDGC